MEYKFQQSVSEQEAAAVIAAIEQFLRDHAAPATAEGQTNPWLRTALLEGADRENSGLTAWGDSNHWG